MNLGENANKSRASVNNTPRDKKVVKKTANKDDKKAAQSESFDADVSENESPAEIHNPNETADKGVSEIEAECEKDPDNDGNEADKLNNMKTENAGDKQRANETSVRNETTIENYSGSNYMENQTENNAKVNGVRGTKITDVPNEKRQPKRSPRPAKQSPRPAKQSPRPAKLSPRPANEPPAKNQQSTRSNALNNKSTDLTAIEPERFSDHEDFAPDWEVMDNDLEEVLDMEDNRQGPLTLGTKGKLVTFYSNGNPHFAGIKFSITPKAKNMESLIMMLEDKKIPSQAGIRYILSLPDGKPISDLNDFLHGRNYAVSSSKNLNKSIDYLNIKPKSWVTRKSSAGRYRRPDVKEKNKPGFQVRNGYIPKARVLTIIKNSDRDTQEKVILNPNTNQSYEEILTDISNMLNYPANERVSGLFTLRPPHKKVKSFSSLLREFKDHHEFLACGHEDRPNELLEKELQHIPPDLSTNGTSSVTESDVSGSSNSGATRRKNSKLPRANQKTSGRGDVQRLTVNAPVSSNIPLIPASTHSRGWASLRAACWLGNTAASVVAVDTMPGLRQSGPRGVKHSPSSPSMVRRRVRDPALYPSPRDDYKAISVSTWRSPFRKTKLPENDTIKVEVYGNRREFAIPRLQPVSDGARPDKKLQLEWVYGYRGRDASNNLHVLHSGELVYYVATVAVVLDRMRKGDKTLAPPTQRLYTQHTEDITSIALHPTQNIVATGQMEGKQGDNAAHIRIWDARNLKTYQIIGVGALSVGVSSLAFSVDSEGDLLLAVDDSDKHILSVWEWDPIRAPRMVAKTPAAADTVVWGCFHPYDSDIILTYGKRHVFFWRLLYDQEKILRDKKSGVFEDRETTPRFVTAVAFAENGDVITGDSNGRITVWSRGEKDVFIINRNISDALASAHTKSVFALCVLGDGTLVSGGGSDIKAWDTTADYKPIKVRMIPEVAGYIRTIVPMPYHPDGQGFYIGTTKNCVLEGTLQGRFSYVIQGHFDELWALAAHPLDLSFVTAGYDKCVTRWDSQEHRMLWRISLNAEARCTCTGVDFDPTGRTIVVGTNVGAFYVIDSSTGQQMACVLASRAEKSVDVVKFSPDFRFLAVGCQDCNIYIFEVLDEGLVYRRFCELQGHRKAVIQIDWLVGRDEHHRETHYLHSVSADYDHLYWNVEAVDMENPIRLRDVTWDNETCVLSYNLLGAWSNLREGQDINAVHRSNNGDVVVVGDNQGSLRLYKYPCSREQPSYQEQKGYTGHTTDVQFLCDDSAIISVGGIEPGIFQWAVVDAPY